MAIAAAKAVMSKGGAEEVLLGVLLPDIVGCKDSSTGGDEGDGGRGVKRASESEWCSKVFWLTNRPLMRGRVVMH